jgi:hypothetical protein
MSAAQGTEDGNAHFVGICLLGDGHDGYIARSPLALRALLQARSLVLHGSPFATLVRPHSDFHPTECPGDDVRSWLRRKRWP